MPQQKAMLQAHSVLIDGQQCEEVSAAVENANHKQRRRTRLKQDQVALMDTATDIETNSACREKTTSIDQGLIIKAELFLYFCSSL